VKGLLKRALPRAVPLPEEKAPATPPAAIPVGNPGPAVTPQPTTPVPGPAAPLIDVTPTPPHYRRTGAGHRAGAAHRAGRKRPREKLDQTVNLWLGIAGCGALFVGFFCPVISVPVIGGMSYFTVLEKQAEQGSFNELGLCAVLVILASLASLFLAIQKQFAWLWATGAAAALAVVITFVSFMSMKQEMGRRLDTEMGDNPFAGLAQMAVEAIRLDFGLAIVLIGAGLLGAAAAVPGKPAR